MKNKILLLGFVVLALAGCDKESPLVEEPVVLVYPYKFQLRNAYRADIGPFVWWGISWDDKVSSTVTIPFHLKRGDLSPIDSSMYPNVCISDSTFRPIYVAHRLTSDSVNIINL